MAAQVKRPRRLYLLNAVQARADLSALETYWRGKQQSEPGTSLPNDFPMGPELAAVGYTAVEDLDGADEEELTDAGLTAQQARAVLDELLALLST